MTTISHIHAVEAAAKTHFDQQEVEAALDRMASEITRLLDDQNPLILCVVIGGIVPTGLLLPRLHFPLELDYLHATRYTGKTQGGHLHWVKRPETPLADRNILIVDDVLDEGITLEAIIDYCHAEGARSVRSAVLVEKDLPQRKGLKKADVTGLKAANDYLVGYGMDYHGHLRNLNRIAAVNLPSEDQE